MIETFCAHCGVLKDSNERNNIDVIIYDRTCGKCARIYWYRMMNSWRLRMRNPKHHPEIFT